ncbi:hypothetical protein [Methylomagnum sp.]
MIGNWLALMLGAGYLVVMSHAAGFRSAVAVGVPIAVLIAVIWRAESLGAYIGWAGWASVSQNTPAFLLRFFAWAMLALPAAILLASLLWK